ncbi:MAG: AAA family ATPase [Candidatus Desulfofervidaceae bacterium]|nr:AAA family ATPase [Candidatus Desulfofervidaceae bacterium]
MKKYLVAIEDLRLSIHPDSLGIESSKDVSPLKEGVFAQERAIEAIKFGISMSDPHYNIYVAGIPGTGITYITTKFLQEVAKEKPIPPDWCYVYNFQNPDAPRAMKLSPGNGKELEKDMADLVVTLRTRIPAAFESEDYQMRSMQLHQDFEKKRHALLNGLAAKAEAEGFLLLVNQVSMMLVPAKEGRPMQEEEVKALPEEEKQRLKEKRDKLQEELNEATKKMRQLEMELREKNKQLDNEVIVFLVGHLIEALKGKYQQEPEVLSYLEEVKQDILKNVEVLKVRAEVKLEIPHPLDSFLKRYHINVLVDNSQTQGAPVVIETNPTYSNLFGAIEREARFGALVTDFTMIKAGALHRANGGYLILRISDLLKWGLSWEALKQAIRNQEVKIEDLGAFLGITTRTLKPQPIPLKLKVVLTGDPLFYQLLYAYDEIFPEIFKVKAELTWDVDVTSERQRTYIACLAKFCEEEGLRPLDKTGIARVLEYSVELSGDKEKLTLKMREINDILKEANFWALQEGSEFIKEEHVKKAIEKKRYRSSLLEERIQDLFAKDLLWVEIDGYKIGQINGLAVVDIGDYSFGRPQRITATVSLGKEGVIDIEREAKLGGNIHSKGVMILSSYFKEHFAHNKPLALAATLCFEQSYGGIEGDSASAAELLALLSAIGKVPLFQGIAVTGSVSQKGEIQSVGGVNEKIEGFFKICQKKGLTGKQGVVIPRRNVRNLMLKEEIVEAVKKGQFYIWAVERIEEMMEIVTGKPSGSLQSDGTYPERTVFYQIDEALREMAKLSKSFETMEEGGET